jgi:hypothetical protein
VKEVEKEIQEYGGRRRRRRMRVMGHIDASVADPHSLILAAAKVRSQWNVIWQPLVAMCVDVSM